jgi:addiction module HigA family antidote
MARNSTIEWTEVTWNPVVGCSKVSDGGRHCYAETMSRRLAGMARADIAAGRNPGRKRHYMEIIDERTGDWNRSLALVEEALEDPFTWRQPSVVFVNSMSDLFHTDVPLSYIKRVFGVMNECSQHTFQILTKRPEVAAHYADRLAWTSNIWIGTSVENALVTHRIKDLSQITDAHVRFLSLEPLLGPLRRLALSKINWVIVGGESGAGARPMDARWVLARKLDVPTNRITAILNGRRAITGDTALRLAHFFGTSAEFWLNLQKIHDLRLAKEKAGNAIENLPTLASV